MANCNVFIKLDLIIMRTNLPAHLLSVEKFLYMHLTVYIGSFQTGYSVVSACVITLRWKDKTVSQELSSSWLEGVICLITVACCGFGAGLFYRVSASFILLILAVVVASLASLALNFRQVRINLYFILDVPFY